VAGTLDNDTSSRLRRNFNFFDSNVSCNAATVSIDELDEISLVHGGQFGWPAISEEPTAGTMA
jgi:hypothetical protein